MEDDIRTGDLIKDEKILEEMFNKHYINIVEKKSGMNLGKKNSRKPVGPKTLRKNYS